MRSAFRSLFLARPGESVAPVLLAGAALFVVVIVAWQAATSGGAPDPLAPHTRASAAVVDIGVLVFREGLECILVLAAVTANMAGARSQYQRPVVVGAVVAAVATLLTWKAAVGILTDLTRVLPALHVQVLTGLLAIVVLLVVMNWFFHKVYWTGWISLHTRRKQRLLDDDAATPSSRHRVLWGLCLLGFSSVYREGFEVVLFLQSYRLRLGNETVYSGVVLGLVLTACVAALTFVAHRRLPYRRMLVLTGILLGCVLLVMVGEQAQEMQLAHWLPTTTVDWLDARLPSWLGLWFAVFPTVETLAAQAVAAVLVVGSYLVARERVGSEPAPHAPA